MGRDELLVGLMPGSAGQTGDFIVAWRVIQPGSYEQQAGDRANLK
jgi:hypothetical protein